VPSAAVLGKPIGHSLSPVLHRAAYAALGLTDWTYDAIECDEAGLAALVYSSEPDVAGYSCTMPLKRAVLEVADSMSVQAAAIGAGNTLLQIDGDWHADNTDWVGVANALAEQGVEAAASRVLVLGAGGTAQAALAAMDGASSVTVLVRDTARTDDLRNAAERLELGVRIENLDRFGACLAECDVVISTLPAGAADHLATADWRSGQVLLDVVYAPWPTPLAESASNAGVLIASGASMLLHQAMRQVELMTGHPVVGTAAEQAMRAALRSAPPQSGV
jgi:shikimate dehydrogenase